MQEISFSKTYCHDEERTYVRLPFDVPEDTDRIEVSYEYPRFREEPLEDGIRRREVNIVDLGLYTPDGILRGWSGSDRDHAFVASYDATAGYRRGPVSAGTWAVALGIYKVESSVQVQVSVRIIPKERLWLAGDLHMHTLNSDGKLSTAEVIDACRRTGLDYIALTDHNNTEQDSEIGNPQGLTVIAGMEYTNYRGHANFFFPEGARSFVGDPLSNSRRQMLDTLREASRAGALISLNHPHCDFCPWEFGFEEVPYDMVEVWNGPMKPSELRAIDWWHSQLCAGRRLAAIGGSDTHRIERLRLHGTPTTFVHARSRSVNDILEALRTGHSFITETISGPRLYLASGEAEAGDAVEAGGTATVTVKNAKAGDVLLVKDGKGSILRKEVAYAGEVSFPFEIERDALFYRAELYRPSLGTMMLCALTNAMYVVV
ncbi:MAG: CehA/McbA family metallohydrolase [Sphaerochaetaceae bacterium]